HRINGGVALYFLWEQGQLWLLFCCGSHHRRRGTAHASPHLRHWRAIARIDEFSQFCPQPFCHLISLWNLRGAPAVGEGSVWLFVLLLAPFAIFAVLGLWRGFTLHPAVQWGNATALHASGFGAGSPFSTAVLVAMWNY